MAGVEDGWRRRRRRKWRRRRRRRRRWMEDLDRGFRLMKEEEDDKNLK